MDPTLPTLLGDGVVRRTALSSGHPRSALNRITPPSVPLGVAIVPGTRGNVVRTVGPSVFTVVLSHVALAEVLLKFLTSVE